jgi:cytochrome c biogenesis protein CcmG/thiol:disulfide interchange protein DsbE
MNAAGPLPEVALPAVPGLKTGGGWDLPGVDTRTFAGQVTVLNIWASWCPYCRSEHDLLKRLSGDGRFKLVGLVHRDSAENARAYLRQAGNPFAALSVDTASRITGALGQRGVPHTYVIGRDLRVALKIPGALSDGIVTQKLLPTVERARAG